MAVLYGAKAGSSTTSDLYTINSSTGAATSVGPIGYAVTGLAFDPTSGVLYGSVSPNSTANPNSLITINPATGAGTLVGAFSIPGAFAVADIAFTSAGALYGWAEGPDDLASVNKATGAGTIVANSALSTQGDGMDFGSDGCLLICPKKDNGNYYSVPAATGLPTLLGVLSGSPIGGGNSIAAGSFGPDSLFYAVVSDPTAPHLVTINKATGVITDIGATDALMDALAWDTQSRPTVCPPAPPANDTYPYDLGAAPDFDGVAYAAEGSSGFARGYKSGGCFAGTTALATAQAGEPDPAPGFPATHSVWLTLRPDFTGTLTAWLTSSDPNMADGIMSVYDWTYLQPVGSLPAPLAQGDNELGTEPQVTFAVVENNRYVFQIDTRDTGGTFVFYWKRSDGTPPANDDFANAEVITGIGGETDGTTTTATAECGEPGLDADPLDGPYNTVWYKWVAPETCTAIIKVAGKGTNGYSHTHNVNVFTGASLTGLTLVPTGTSILGVSWAMTGGVTYYVRVDNGEADPPGPYDPAGTPDDFTLFWETDSLDWRMRVGTFTAGTTHVVTGLGKQLTAVILYFGGVPDGVYTDTGYMVGAGAADGTDQWAVGMAYPRNSVHGIPLGDTSLNGNQYHQTRFSQAAAISVPGLLGGVYAEATVVSLNANGSFDLSWGTNPGDGSLCGFVALSGVEAAAGSFSYSNGAPGTEVVVPGFRTRAFMIGSTGTAPGGIPDPGSTPAGYVQAACWNEGVPAQAYIGSDAYGAQIESGIGWYGGNSYDGLFLNSGSVGQSFFQSAGGVGEIGGAVVGALSFDILHDDPAFSGGTGWLALGGYGWHTIRTPTAPTLLTGFWTQAALAYGPGYLNYGAFDEQDSQFDMTEWTNDCQTNPFPDLSFATPTSRTAHTGRIQTQLDPASNSNSEENYVETGNVSVAVVPKMLNNVTVTSVGGAGAELVLFGNYLPPAPLDFAAVSFSHLKSGQRRGGLQIR